jgi:hypothetical protein
MRNGYDIRGLAEQFDAKPAEIRQRLRGDLDPATLAATHGRNARRWPAHMIRLNDRYVEILASVSTIVRSVANGVRRTPRA